MEEDTGITDPEKGPENETSFLLRRETAEPDRASSKHRAFPTNLVSLTLREITNIAHRPTVSFRRDQTRFFRIVKGGNVRFVREILEHLNVNDMKAELAWCLGDPSFRFGKRHSSACLGSLVHGFWFMFLFTMTIILTPVFYIVHTLVHESIMTTRKKLDDIVKLPLAFALLSQEEEMVALFLQYGCQVTWPDSEGNTIYHYLADVSVERYDMTKSCHLILCKLIKNMSTMKNVITEQENNEGNTALEYIAKYGSVTFFEYIVREQVACGQPVLRVARDELWSRDTAADRVDLQDSNYNMVSANDEELSAIDDEQRSLNVLDIDVSKYDQGDIFKRHSLLLQAISGRAVESMTEANANCILQSKLLSSWIKQKSRRYFSYCLLSHALNIAITGLLVWYLVKNGGDMNPLPLFTTYLMYLSENLGQAERQLQTVLNTTSFEEIVRNLDKTPGADYGLHTLTCLARVNHTDRGTINCTLNALTRINKSCGYMADEDLWGNTLGRPGANYEKIWKDKVVLVLLIMISSILAMNILLDLIMRLGYLCANYNCKAAPKNAASGFFLRWLPGSYLDKQLTVTMASLFFFYIFSHVLMMETIRSRSMWIRDLIGFMLVNVEEQKVAVEQGRLRAIINGLTSLADRINDLETLSNKIMNICILIRFFQAIHALRLLPNIGFFIITTKKMAKHLLQFALVFVIVSLAFGTIFHFVMRNPKCQALKEHGFETLAASLFSAYQISLGSGGFSFMDNNINAKIAYIAYTITAMLLLLNLIIAVMTTTALELNQSPWRPALCRVELWDEYLGTEIAVMTLAMPFRALGRLCNKMVPTQRSKKPPEPTTIQLTYVKEA